MDSPATPVATQRRTLSATPSGPRVAILEIGIHRKASGGGDFGKMSEHHLAGNSGGESGNPREKAKPELVVASARKPRRAR